MKKIQAATNTYLKFVSTEVLMDGGLSDRAFRVWAILQFKYRQHVNSAEDSIKVYQCCNAWLAETLNTSVRNIERAIKELHEANLLYSFQPKGEAAYRVPVDPSDTNYQELLSVINAFEANKTLKKVKWIEHNTKETAKAEVEAKTEIVKTESKIVVETTTATPEASDWDYNRFINYIKNQGLTAKADVLSKSFTVNTGNNTLKAAWNKNLVSYGWVVH
ncbi:hypothetical protein AB6Q85_003295 [Vibrio cholerae]